MATWTIDPMHSEIGFKIRHMVVSSVSGKFTSFEGNVKSDKDDFTDALIFFTAAADSIDTGAAQRDEHLKSPEFFDAAVYPAITFTSTNIRKDGDEYEVTGDLTMKGITKPITLDVVFGGIGPNTFGQIIAGFELKGKLNRKDFGLSWNAVTETGGIAVSDEVKINIDIELVKEA